MSYKTILMLLERAWRTEQLDVAFTLARQNDAHLVALYAASTPTIPAYALVEAGSVAEKLKAMQRSESARRLEEARSAFESAAARHSHRTVEWRNTEQDPLSAATLAARYADLVIAAQPDSSVEVIGNVPDTHHSLALATGRPVLYVPYAGRFPHVGRRVLVAWNASREAARAVADSLPLLKQASWVRVLVVNPGREHGEVPGADIALYLARHGVKVSVASRTEKSIGVGEIILSDAADDSSDLIVMGSYGHSRIRELMLGGATRTMLGAMTVPVLMAH